MTEMQVPYSVRNESRFCQGQAEVSAEREEWEMANKDIFRTTVFGGYQKEDVMDYVRSLENEKETVKILASKENAGIKAELEQEKKANGELKNALLSCKEQLGRLEAECRRLRNSVRDGETKLRRLQDIQRQPERLKKSNHELMERCRRLEADHRIVKGNGEARKSGLNGVLEKLVPAARAARQERKAGIPFSPEASAPEPMPELSAGFMGMEESASMEEPVPAPSNIEETTARTFPEAEALDTLETKSLDTQLSKEEPAVITEEPEPGYPEEDDMESAQELYRRHAENVNRSIITAQERIARLLEELQLDTASDEKTPRADST